MKFVIFFPISLYQYLWISLWQNKLIFDTINWTTWVILKMTSNLQITHFFLPSQMMSSVVFFCWGLSLNLIGAPAQPDGSYKIRSVRLSVLPSVLLSVRFLGIGSLVFSETYHDVRGPYIVVCDRARFFGKNPHQAKISKNGQKCPKNMIFGLF